MEIYYIRESGVRLGIYVRIIASILQRCPMPRAEQLQNYCHGVPKIYFTG